MSLKILLTILIGYFSNAVELFDYNQSVRQLGMGGVYIFDENDAGSLLNNPAYTCYTEGMNWTIFNIGVGINGLQIYNDLTSIGTIDGIGSLTPLYGKNIWVGAGGHTTMTFPCFGFSGYDAGGAGFQLYNPPFPNMDMTYINDYAIMGGGAFKLGPILSMGLNVKRITRVGGTATVGASTLASATSSSLLNVFSNEGNGYGIDVGLAARFDSLPFNPTFSMMWKDAGSVQFVKSKGSDSPDRLKDNMILAATVEGSIPLLGFAAGIEYRHVTESGEQFGKKLHLGTELTVAMFDLRAGFYQGYTTYGVGVDLFLMQLNAATYSVEKGAYPGQSEDARIQVSLDATLSFDPSFNLVGFGAANKKRKLKQRR
jgi:hypothetical protein